MQKLKSLFARKERYLIIALAVLIVDQWSKWLVEIRMPLGTSLPVIGGFFNLTHVRNTGIAFGLFAAGNNLLGTILLTLLGLAGLSLLTLYFIRTPPEDRLMMGSLCLILGGAVGNLADRIATGGVTDFLDFYYGSYHWYTFNVADSAITVGIVLMTLQIAFAREETPAGGATDDAEGAERSA